MEKVFFEKLTVAQLAIQIFCLLLNSEVHYWVISTISLNFADISSYCYTIHILQIRLFNVIYIVSAATIQILMSVWYSYIFLQSTTILNLLILIYTFLGQSSLCVYTTCTLRSVLHIATYLKLPIAGLAANITSTSICQMHNIFRKWYLDYLMLSISVDYKYVLPILIVSVESKSELHVCWQTRIQAPLNEWTIHYFR
jgi:hypothetical protein